MALERNDNQGDGEELTFDSLEEALSVLHGVPLGVAKEATDNMGKLVRYETTPDGKTNIVKPEKSFVGRIKSIFSGE